MSLWKWSQSAAANGTADASCPFPEGMAPSALNDGARGMMAAIAKYRDDIGGMLVTSGTSTAYTLFSNQGFDTFASMHGVMICFTPHATNGDNGTSLNVDAKGPKPILTAPGVGLPGGILVQGTPYAVSYNNTDGAFYLHGFYNDPFNVPLLGGLDHWDTVTPNSSFIFPLGQAISRTVYAAAFARWGVKFGPGNGSTTFNVPNKAGRVSAMIEPAASLLTSTFFGGDSTQIGSVGGSEKHTLTPDELASHYHSAGIKDDGHSHGSNAALSGSTWLLNPGSSVTAYQTGAATINNATTGVRVTSSNGLDTTNSTGGGQAHKNVQPTILCNYIIRII